MADAFDPQQVYDRGLAEGMEIAARARCSNCAAGWELYYGFARPEGYSAMRQWRHEGNHCQCGAWQIWDEMVRRGLLDRPARWEPQSTHPVMCAVHTPQAPHPGCKACDREAAGRLRDA
jgi:hypothetical protein